MSISVCVLASSSAANCTYVATETTRILVDAGLSTRETTKRLEALDVSIESIDAVCMTHEHDDHRKGLAVMHRRFGTCLYANQGTMEALSLVEGLEEAQWNVFTTGASFVIGDLTIEPFSVPHDGYDPVGFTISSGESRIGVVTDMGMATNLIRDHLRRCHALVLECNYDDQLLRDSDRPWSLKQRIAGRQGHLSNAQSEELIQDIAWTGLKAVYMAHLSQACNSAQLATQAMKRGLAACGCAHVDIKQTYQDRISDLTRV